MEALLSYLPTFQATKPKDIVFAVASLANDYLHVVPDYRKSSVLICREVIQNTVSTTGSLNIICRPWAPIDPCSPSWVPQLSKYPFTFDSNSIYIRTAGDSLVGHPGQCPYTASGSIRASATFTGDEGQPVLMAKGFRLKENYDILEPASNGVVPASWVKNGPNIFMNSDYKNEFVKEMYWHTLVCDRDGQGMLPPSWMRRACEELYKGNESSTLYTKSLLEIPSDEPGALSSSTKSFLRRVQAVTWNRRMIRSGDQSFGLLPEQARVGDDVCILFGCDVPVLLRKHDDGLWEFIGEAYIHQMMDGEAMDRPYKEEIFCLK